MQELAGHLAHTLRTLRAALEPDAGGGIHRRQQGDARADRTRRIQPDGGDAVEDRHRFQRGVLRLS